MKIARAVLWTLLLVLLFPTVMAEPVMGDKSETAAESNAPSKLKIRPIKGRPTKLLHQSLFGQDGRLGYLEDIDHDGTEELVYLIQLGSQLSLRVTSIIDGSDRLDVELGKGYPAGLSTLNLDDDPATEFIVAYGSRRDRILKKVGFAFASGLLSGLGTYALYPSFSVTVIVSPGAQGLDLTDLVALDDDGTLLWHRDLEQEARQGSPWDNTRFRMIIPLKEQRSAMIVVTNNKGPGVIGISGLSGETVWENELGGETADPKWKRSQKGPDAGSRRDKSALAAPAKWSASALEYDEKLLPVIYHGRYLTLLDPDKGNILLEGSFDLPISLLPTLTTFQSNSKPAFLFFGESRSELQMVSISDGELLWSKQLDAVRVVLPLSDNRFIAVSQHGIKTFSGDGDMLDEAAMPETIKTNYDPVYRDLNGDGSHEIVFISGKKVTCWNPFEDQILWTESLRSFVGGVNPVALYNRFYDIDGDGWLDVPAATGGGKGRWISGKTGEVLLEAGGAVGEPIVGDWDHDGTLELFWWKTWYEITEAKKKK